MTMEFWKYETSPSFTVLLIKHNECIKYQRGTTTRLRWIILFQMKAQNEIVSESLLQSSEELESTSI